MAPKYEYPPGRGRGSKIAQAMAEAGPVPSKGWGRGEIESTGTCQQPARVKANLHPDQIQLDNQIKRRKPEEIRADKERAQAAATKEKEEKEAREQKMMQQLADTEDRLRREDIVNKDRASRPDLYTYRSAVETTG
jgi:hypothetical protein